MNKNLKYILPFTISCVYFVISCIYLNFFNPHEDAYIMFRYVEMFVQGQGITYYPGGEHLEGATDFLWFLFLSLLNGVGVNVAISAVFLNSIGVFIIVYVIFETLSVIKNKKLLFLSIPLSCIWLLFIPTFAALGGFSVLSYCGFIVLALHYLNTRKNIKWVPILSIVIALYRPDGVILGVCFTLLGLLLSSSQEIKKYIINAGIAFSVGVGYFIWRYNYFGELLPLPLYVKQPTSFGVAFNKNMVILFSKVTIIVLIVFLVFFIKQKRSIKKNILILFIPSIVFIILISMAFQSQNIAYRFQAPVIYMLYYLFVVMLVNILERGKGYLYLVLIYIFIVLAFILVLKEGWGRKLINNLDSGRTYIDSFPKKLNDNILEDGDVMALTEAGRLAYWSSKKVKIIDLIGLNTKYTAKNILTEKYLENINPDIIMVYTDLIFENDKKNVCWIQNRQTIENSFPSLNVSKEAQAAFIVEKYLLNHWEEYDVFFVKYVRSRFLHVYAIKKKKNRSPELYKLLNESFYDYKSYFDLKKQYK